MENMQSLTDSQLLSLTELHKVKGILQSRGKLMPQMDNQSMMEWVQLHPEMVTVLLDWAWDYVDCAKEEPPDNEDQ